MNNTHPIVSVVLPVFNQHPEYLRHSLESILAQSLQNFELLIIDDGSTKKECLSILEKFASKDTRIHILRNTPNRGIIRSLNRGLENARGKYIARMDSDDIAFPDRLQKQADFLEKNPDIDLVGTWVTIIDMNGEKIGTLHPPTDSELLKRNILKRNLLIHPTWMFRPSLISRIGHYREDAHSVEDYDFLLRTAKNGKIGNIPEILLSYRFNENGISFKKNKEQEWNTIRLRMRAIFTYGYPKWQAIFLIQPLLLFFFLPWQVKRFLLKYFFKHA